jgi:hypothetical protein
VVVEIVLMEEEVEVRLPGVVVVVTVGKLDGNVVGNRDIAKLSEGGCGGGGRGRGREGVAGVGEGRHGGGGGQSGGSAVVVGEGGGAIRQPA